MIMFALTKLEIFWSRTTLPRVSKNYLKRMDKYTLTFNGKYYSLNMDRISQYCLVSSEKPSNESEITEAYDYDENGEFRLTSKINREITSPGNSQGDMFTYDLIKMLITKLIECPLPVYSNETQTDFGFAVAFNTLVSYGMIEEIKE